MRTSHESLWPWTSLIIPVLFFCRISWIVFDVATRQSLEEVSVLVRPELLLAPADLLSSLGVTQEQLFTACAHATPLGPFHFASCMRASHSAQISFGAPLCKTHKSSAAPVAFVKFDLGGTHPADLRCCVHDLSQRLCCFVLLVN